MSILLKSRCLIVAICLLSILLFSCSCLPPLPCKLDYPGVIQLTQATNLSLTDPAWSPDGLRLVAVSMEGKVGDDNEIYVVDVKTGEFTQVSDADPHPLNARPSWSPDGDRIVFTSDEFGKFGIGFLDPDSGEIAYLSSDAEAKWSPDGQSLVVRGPSRADYGGETAHALDIAILDLETKQRQQIFDWPTSVLHGGMDWAKESNRIAFSFQSWETRDPNLPSNRDIYTINTDGSGLTRIIASEEDELRPAWSPDGGKLAYVKGRGHTLRYLWVSNADGSCLVQLLDIDGIIAPAWSPDGKYIAFKYCHNLYLLDLTSEPIAERLKGLDCH